MRRLMHIALTLVTAAVATGVAAGPAQGTEGWPHLILFHDTFSRGKAVIVTGHIRDLNGNSDEASSLRNRDDVAWVVYDDTKFEDRRYCIRPGEGVGDLGSYEWKFNDKISSAMPLKTASCENNPPFWGIG